MINRPTIAVVTLLCLGVAGTGAHADPAAARACAGTLPKDAKAIFDTTLPQVAPGSDLRALLTSNTRRLVIAGTIERGSAKDSAVAAGKCLQRAGT